MIFSFLLSTLLIVFKNNKKKYTSECLMGSILDEQI